MASKKGKGGVETEVVIDWKGELVKEAAYRAAETGIDQTMAATVIEAKTNHPGWNNVTGNAEGSISITQPAKRQSTKVFGRWGSMAVNYMLILEIKRGAALRTAADITYKTLIKRIRSAFRTYT